MLTQMLGECWNMLDASYDSKRLGTKRFIILQSDAFAIHLFTFHFCHNSKMTSSTIATAIAATAVAATTAPSSPSFGSSCSSCYYYLDCFQ